MMSLMEVVPPDYTSEQDHSRELLEPLNERDMGSARAKRKDLTKRWVSQETWLGHTAL